MNALVPVGVAAMCGPAAAWLDAMIASRAATVPLSAIELEPVGSAAGSVAAAGDEAATGPVAGSAASAPTVRSRVRAITARRTVVIVVAAGLAAAQTLRTGTSWLLPAQILLIAGGAALAAGDVEWLLLPKRPVWITSAAVVTAALAGAAASDAWNRLATALVCAIALTAALAVISVGNPRWMGFGDVRLAFPIGLVLAWSGGPLELVAGMFLANVLAGAVAAVLVVTGRAGPGSALPFGAFLAAGTVAALLIA